MSASMRQSYVSLHFQLEGAVDFDHTEALHTPLRAGDTNLSFVPPFTDTFDLDDANRGTVFNIVLSPNYFEGLARRYPHLWGTYYEQMLQEKPFCLRDRHLRITPEMWGVIQRIQRRDPAHHAGSLFLEAQILELLALQLEQLDQPVEVEEDGVSLSSDDRERIHAARDVLLDNLTDPPTLAEIAYRVGYSDPAHLTHAFRKQYGIPPSNLR